MLLALLERTTPHSSAVRTRLCNLFFQTQNADHSLIFSLINQLGLAAVTNYSIFLELTMYQIVGHDLLQETKIVAEYLRSCSEEAIQKFVIELYDSLEKRDSRDYHSDFTPDYPNVAVHFIERNDDRFRRSLEERTFSEQ